MTWFDASPHGVHTVVANGIRLQYLDWGGAGPTLIFVHGLLANPHIFDDIAPAFVDRFRVIAYARRGHGGSDVAGPYGTPTLTADLLGLMNALRIEKAHLVGWSMGGNEITAMAADYPERVERLVYLDSAYDYADPEFEAAVKAMPTNLLYPPSSAMMSLDAYLSYEKASEFSALDDMRRVEAYLREVVVVQPDGGVKPRMPQAVVDAFFSSLWTNPRRDYRKVHAAALAIYAQSMPDLQAADVRRRESAVAWEQKYMSPFRLKSMERIRRELKHVEVMSVAGAHDSFFLVFRQEIVNTMRCFLGESAPSPF